MTDTDINVTSPAKGEVLPIRPLDEAAALVWLQSQPGGRTTLSGAELGRRWGWDRRRVSRRLREWKKAGVVRGRGSTIAVADSVSPVVPEGATGDATVAPDVAPIVPSVVAPFDIETRSDINRFSELIHTTGERRSTIDLAAYAAAIGLATVGITLSVVGMIETATYALAVGGVLFCALALAADVLTLGPSQQR